MAGSVDKQLVQLFRTCDTAGNGFIRLRDFSNLCLSLGIDEDDAAALFRELDADRDHRISLADFSSGFREFLCPSESEESRDEFNSDHNGWTKERRRASMASITNELMLRKGRGRFNEFPGRNSMENGIDYGGKRGESVYQTKTTITSELFEGYFKTLPEDSRSEIKAFDDLLQSNPSMPTIILDRLESVLKIFSREIENMHIEKIRMEDAAKRQHHEHNAILQMMQEEMQEQIKKAQEEKEKAKQPERPVRAPPLKKSFDSIESIDSKSQDGSSYAAAIEENAKALKELHTKLEDSHQSNREIRAKLQDALTSAGLLRSELANSRLQYEEKCTELHNKREEFLEQVHQHDCVRLQLDALTEANRKLQDTNDKLRQLKASRSNPVSRSSSQRSSTRKFVVPYLNPSHVLSQELDLSTGPTSIISNADSGNATMVDMENVTFRIGELCNRGSDRQISVQEELKQSPEFHSAEEDICMIPSEEKIKKRRSERNVDTGSEVSIHSSEQFIDGLEGVTRWEPCELTRSINEMSSQSAVEIPERTYKVVLAGDTCVGKSSYILRLCKGQFIENMATTLGVDYKVLSLRIDGIPMVIQLWDTAGQERFRSIAKLYFRRADGVALMYDVNSTKSFENIRQWLCTIDESCIQRIPIVVCGNKIDMREDTRLRGQNIVSYTEGNAVARECGADFFETSTKTGENIRESLIELARKMISTEDIAIQSSTLRLTSKSNKKKNSKPCCASGANSECLD